MSDEQNDTEPETERSLGMVERVNDHLESRRGFLSNTAKVGAGAIALGAAGTGTVAAEGTDYSDSDYEDKNALGYGALSDVEIVRFALMLERLEATFYTEAVGDEPIAEMGTAGDAEGARLGEHDVERSDIAAQLANPSMRYSTFQRIKQVRDHEQAHVKALEGVLSAVGSDPSFASTLEFEFPYETVEDFYTLAYVFEDTGAAAYTSAAPVIDTEKYLAPAAQILAVEARHASYFRTLANPLPAGTGARNPFPEAFQDTMSVAEVVQAVLPFVKGVDEVSQVLALVTTD
ncbi:MAG TPA: ferritin-like domain-containing protein [Halococcus sp.]|nr:ferritin-like domain-containing protein [Halococcus sp.]